MATAKQMEKLDKLYAMYVDSATTANEKLTAHGKMKTFAKKFKVNLAEFIEAKDFDKEVELRQHERADEARERREGAEAKEYKATVKRPSRRSLIVNMLKTNMFDATSVNEVLIDVYEYMDKKANKKAISGTMYDFRVNKDWFFRLCKCGRIVTEVA